MQGKDSNSRNERERYGLFLPKKKAKVTKYTLENGVTASLHNFNQIGGFNNFKKSTVCEGVKQY